MPSWTCRNCRQNESPSVSRGFQELGPQIRSREERCLDTPKLPESSLTRGAQAVFHRRNHCANGRASCLAYVQHCTRVFLILSLEGHPTSRCVAGAYRDDNDATYMCCVEHGLMIGSARADLPGVDSTVKTIVGRELASWPKEPGGAAVAYLGMDSPRTPRFQLTAGSGCPGSAHRFLAT